MSDNTPDPAIDAVTFRDRAIAGGDNEGGGEPDGPQAESELVEAEITLPDYDPAEMASLHVRVIALENLVIALLATASDRQLELASTMASYIAPRPGFAPHGLTTRAAAHMNDLVDRASRFRGGEVS